MSKYRKDAGDVKKLNPGKRLELALGNLNLTQTGLAEECGLSPQYVNNILHRGQRITQDFAQELARIGINLNWLFVGEGPMFLEEYDRQRKKEKPQAKNVEKLLKETALNLHQVAELLKKERKDG